MSGAIDRRRLAVALLALAGLGVAACAEVGGNDIGSPIFDGTTPDGVEVNPPITTLPSPAIDAIRVPIDFFTIQAAADAAQPGDLILVEPGVYGEEIVVRSPDIVIRGRDRNTVFVDGLHGAETGIRVRADGVAIENLTVRNYTLDGISVEGDVGGVAIDGFRALHVTTSNTGRHGIAARNARNVEIREGWMSGAGGAGVAISGCTDCATLVETTLAEFSARGFSVVDATDGVQIIRSTSRNNRAGVVIADGGAGGTRGAVVAGSVILNNGFATTPRFDDTWDASFGTGVHVSATVASEVRANRIGGNTRAGVLLGASVDGRPGDPVGPVVVGNEVTGHLEGDIVLALEQGVIDPGLCIGDNPGAQLVPAGAEASARCDGGSEAPTLFSWVVDSRSTIPYANGPVPPGIEGLTDADSRPPIPAGPVQPVDVRSVLVPEG